MKTVLICVVLAFSAVLPGRAMSEQEVKVPSLWSWRAPAEKAREHMRGVILLEAEGFAKYGRWRLETQFIH
ncbi:MAG: hypothetical protein PHS50_13310, partial [Kiritimatiellae bacterium]|nr:hypothetical protein [Kiritimatiellia bacterium]